MAPKKQATPEGEKTIQVPAYFAPAISEVPDAELLALQEGVFGGKKQTLETPEPKKDSPPKEGGITRDRAMDLFQGAAKLKESKAETKVKEPVVEEVKEPEKKVEAAPVPENFVDVTSLTAPVFEEEKKEEPLTPGDLSKENNIKKLRQIATGLSAEKEALLAEKQQLEEKLTQAASQINSRETEALKARIAKLEPYEQLFALHENPEFKEKYIGGVNTLISEMREIVKSYGVEEGVVEDILATESRKELDELLMESFESFDARADLKNLKQKVIGLIAERKDYEKRPQDALAHFQAQKEQIAVENEKKRNAYFGKVVNDGWSMALTDAIEAPDDAKIFELVEIPGKKDHNEKVVRPILGDARKAYEMGIAHIERMIRNGSVVDKSFASWLARTVQTAVAAANINAARSTIYKQWQSVMQTQEKSRAVQRPAINGGARAMMNGEVKGGKRDRAAEIYNAVTKEASE